MTNLIKNIQKRWYCHDGIYSSFSFSLYFFVNIASCLFEVWEVWKIIRIERDKLSKSNIVQVYHLDFLSILRLLQFHPLLLHARIKGLFFILNRSINVNFLNCRWVCTIYKLGPSKKYTIFYDFIIILRVSLMKLWIWPQFWSEELRFS